MTHGPWTIQNPESLLIPGMTVPQVVGLSTVLWTRHRPVHLTETFSDLGDCEVKRESDYPVLEGP